MIEAVTVNSTLVLAVLVVGTLLIFASSPCAISPKGWKYHQIKQGDGKGGWSIRPAEYQLLHYREPGSTMGFGLAQMDDGRIILLGTWDAGIPGGYEKPIVTFSRDGGRTWDDLQVIHGAEAKIVRPCMLAYLGEGNLTFSNEGQPRYFSQDYGKTWHWSPDQPANNGGPWHVEGNPLVDRDTNGNFVRMAEIGWNFAPGELEGWPQIPTKSRIRWSTDGGRTWTGEVQPPTWLREVTYEGNTFIRGTGEGSLVRAANGWLVAALRTNIPPFYFGKEEEDQAMGTAVSISKDNGLTWSPYTVLFSAGRMHAHLLAMSNGCLVMTVTVRHDYAEDGGYASYRRGCEAIISRDNGLTWELDKKYILDDWQFYDPKAPGCGFCGHLYSIALDERTVLTVHNNYLTKGISLIRWCIE